MIASQRASLITRGLRIAETLFPVSVTFAGQQPIQGSARATAASAALRFGGETSSVPEVIYLRKEVIPAGVLDSLVPTETTFAATFEGRALSLRLNSLDNEPSEPQVRLTCNLAAR